MKLYKAISGALFVTMIVVPSCSTVKRPTVDQAIEEEEEEEEDKKDSLQEWWEMHDLDLYRPWHGIDESMSPFTK